jgi:hypothetical protein
MNVMTLKLVRTCWACPEQYDVLNEKKETVGYLRLRHGNFRAWCPNALDEMVYHSEPKGDGIFDDDERESHLTEAVKAIQNYYNLEPTGLYLLEDEYKDDDLLP